MLWLFSLLILAAFVITSVGWFISEPGYNGSVSDHFNGTTFENPGDVPTKDFFDVMKWYMQREQGEWTQIPDEELVFAEAPAETISEGLVITYVNHSTFLIQTEGLNILTDPIWSDRVSPFSFAGPQRFRSAGVRFEDLPPIDLVLISHNHYDHLDIETLKKLNDQFSPVFITPLGVSLMLQAEGIAQTQEMDWWGVHSVSGGLQIHSVQAQHFSARGLFDRDKTLWSGYVIETPSGGVYFAGDTGYGNFFKEIGTRFDIKVGLIPIGAYKPQWFMSPMHINPEEAIKVHKDVGADISFGMHFGTFPLADDGMDDPVNDFTKAIQKPENSGVNFKLLTEGDSFRLIEE